MKILKVKIKRTQTASGTHYEYPKEYIASKINVLCYETMSPTGDTDVKNRGNTDEFCIGVVQDKDAAGFLKSADIVEVDKATAKTLGVRWTVQVEKINNQDEVIRIAKKIVANQALTVDEKKALDPEDTTSGIVKSKHIADVIDEIVPLAIA